MKFSEKLQKLRKENNLSQEQLADKLDVSRQSVSKWESGQTYPEMDKLLTMCKLFNITLDDLTNDEVDIKEVKTKPKNKFDGIIDDVMYIIDKSYSMFTSMESKERGKCIGELIILFIILLLFRIPFEYIISIGNNVLYYLPRGTYLFQNLWSFMINIVYLILFIFTFLYIYKTYFLDKYKEKENKEENSTEEKKQTQEEQDEIKEEKRNNQKNIKEKKHPVHNFGTTLYEILGSIITFCFKAFLVFISIPFIISFVFLFIVLFILIILLFKGIFYFGFIICALAAILLNWIILKLIASFLFEYKPKFTTMFASFIIGLSLAGIGTGLSIFDILSTDFIDEAPKTNLEYTEKEFEIEYKDNTVLYHNYYNYENNFIVDETLGNKIKIVTSYYKDINFVDIENSKYGEYNTIEIWEYPRYNKKIFNTILDNLKNKEIYDYDRLYEYEISIYASSEVINKLKTNYQNYQNYRYTSNYENEIKNYEEKIDTLEVNNGTLQETVDELNSKIEELENENESLKNKIKEYKENLENILGN